MLISLLLFARVRDEVAVMGVIVFFYYASSAGTAVVVPQTLVCTSKSHCLFFCCLYITILTCIPRTTWGIVISYQACLFFIIMYAI